MIKENYDVVNREALQAVERRLRNAKTPEDIRMFKRAAVELTGKDFVVL